MPLLEVEAIQALPAIIPGELELLGQGKWDERCDKEGQHCKQRVWCSSVVLVVVRRKKADRMRSSVTVFFVPL
jgi:hypothetical protein